jgi:hypothetical protein
VVLTNKPKVPQDHAVVLVGSWHKPHEKVRYTRKVKYDLNFGAIDVVGQQEATRYGVQVAVESSTDKKVHYDAHYALNNYAKDESHVGERDP